LDRRLGASEGRSGHDGEGVEIPSPPLPGIEQHLLSLVTILTELPRPLGKINNERERRDGKKKYYRNTKSRKENHRQKEGKVGATELWRKISEHTE
jgi:hypothetical protein